VFTFLVFLLLAVQVAYNLYATTMVTSAASDAARRLAGAAGATDPNGAQRAEAWVRELLGAYGRENVELVETESEGGVVSVRVVARNPGFVPSSVRRPLGFDRIDRTVRMRVEEQVP